MILCQSKPVLRTGEPRAESLCPQQNSVNIPQWSEEKRFKPWTLCFPINTRLEPNSFTGHHQWHLPWAGASLSRCLVYCCVVIFVGAHYQIAERWFSLSNACAYQTRNFRYTSLHAYTLISASHKGLRCVQLTPLSTTHEWTHLIWSDLCHVIVSLICSNILSNSAQRGAWIKSRTVDALS